MTSDTEDFYLSCQNSSSYPHNLLHHDLFSHYADALSQRLQSQSESLFVKSEACVEFLDLRFGHQECEPSCASSLDELKVLLRAPLVNGNSDPECRFVQVITSRPYFVAQRADLNRFLLAPHSRAALKITNEMFTFLITYHDVPPFFLDFVFPFGYQQHARDSQFSSFREDSRLDSNQWGPQLASLGRSGRDLRMCYNLRCVESSPHEVGLKWSVRQSAVYHSFDLETGHSLWINVKGNDLFQTRVNEASRRSSSSRVDTCGDAFSTSLETHLLFCDWSAENWRWYINELEDNFQRLTTNVLVVPVDSPSSPTSTVASFLNGPNFGGSLHSPLSRSSTFQSWLSAKSKPENHAQPGLSASPTLVGTPKPIPHEGNSFWTSQSSPRRHQNPNGFKNPLIGSPRLDTFKSLRTNGLELWRKEITVAEAENVGRSSHQDPVREPIGVRRAPSELPPEISETSEAEDLDKFSVRDLQSVEYVEEKVQEALLVLGYNMDVLEALRHHYQYVASHAEFPRDYKGAQRSLARFDRCVTRIEKDLRMLQSRTRILLQLIANRKGLLSSVMQFKSVKLNESFARKNQQSADRMERFNAEMNDIARKTRQETVSMRVITLVTLFFLPATFIATFMSTGILSFERGKREFRVKGLEIYLAIALPMTAVTFFAWFIIYRLAKRDRSPRLSQNESAAHSSA